MTFVLTAASGYACLETLLKSRVVCRAIKVNNTALISGSHSLTPAQVLVLPAGNCKNLDQRQSPAPHP